MTKCLTLALQARPPQLASHPVPLSGYGIGAGQEASLQGGTPAAQGGGLSLPGMQVGTDRPVLFHGRQWHHQAQGPTPWVPADWQAGMSTNNLGQPVSSHGPTVAQVCIAEIHVSRGGAHCHSSAQLLYSSAHDTQTFSQPSLRHRRLIDWQLVLKVM